MATESITKLKTQVERARTALANMREDAEKAVEMGSQTLLTTAGGGVAGLLSVKMPTIPGTEINSSLAAGTLLSGLALVGAAGKMSGQMNALGAGMLAVEAAEAVKKALA